MKWLEKRMGWSMGSTKDLDPDPEELDWENAEVVIPDEGVKLVRLSHGFNIATYNLQVFSPEVEPAEETSAYRWSESDKRVLADLPAMLELIEEQMTNLLPKDYTVRITEWNK